MSISDYQLGKLTQSMEYINQELIGLTEKQPAGTSPPPSEHICELQRTTSADGAAQVTWPNLHQITKRIEFANNRLKRIRDSRVIIQTSTKSLQGTTSTCKFDYYNISDGAAQVSCQNLHQITKRIELVNNHLKRIRDGTDIIQTPTQSLQGTTSTGKFDYDNISSYIL